MADIQLKVSPDVLQSKAQEIMGQIGKIENYWNRIHDTVSGSSSYWQGEASDYHRKYLKDNDDDVKKLLKRLKEHPTDLQKMAGIYVKAEETASEAASALPDDVII